MTSPTVSVVIPAYNNGSTLGETIDSVLAQDGVDFEVIIADHASSDDTLAVMQRYAGDPRVSVLTTPAGGGAERNWNRVTSLATGDFVKLVCGDDVLRPGVLARQSGILRTTGAVLTACRRDVTDADGRVLMAAWGLRGIDRPMSGARAAAKAVRAGSNLFGEPASVMMRRSVLEHVGGWDATYPYLIDQATYSRVLLEGDFVPDAAVGATFRLSDSQWSAVLIASQASQARSFHAALRSEHPSVVSRADVLIGDLRASVMARLRRFSYSVLRWRSR